MVSPVKILLLLSTLLLLACSITDSNENSKGSENSIDGFEKEEIHSGNGVLVSAYDTAVYKFTGEAGKCYHIELRDSSNLYKVYLASLSHTEGDFVIDDTIPHYSTHTGLKVEKTGEYSVGIVVEKESDTVTTFSYKITVKEVPAPTFLTGKWLLVGEQGNAFGKSFSASYSVSEAEDVIEFEGDNLTIYRYDLFEGTLATHRELFAQSVLSEMNYTLSDNRLTLFQSNGSSKTSYTYVRYSGQISDLEWLEDVFVAPDELIGTWFHSGSDVRFHFYSEGDYDSINYYESYESAEESKSIIVVSRDSVIRYERNGFSVSEHRESVTDNMYTLFNCTASQNSFSRDVAGYEKSADFWGEGYMSDEYTRYNGELPPAEWSVVNLPENSVDLFEGVMYTDSSPVLYDTLCFKFAVEKGESYRISSGTENMEAEMFLINSKPEQISPIGWWGDDIFTADTTGYYYIVCTVEYLSPGYSDQRFSLLFEKETTLWTITSMARNDLKKSPVERFRLFR